MGAKFPMTTVPNSLRQFLKGVPERNVPKKVTTTYLLSIGLKSSNDRSIIPVLKFVGLLDGAGAPTDAYRQFRNKSDGPRVLAALIKQSYKELYDTYEAAQSQSDETLQNFFRAKTDVGERSISLMLAAFKVLCEFGDFAVAEASRGGPAAATAAMTARPSAAPDRAPQVHINLQVHLPQSNDPSTYDAIFDAMERYLRKIT